MQALVPNLRLPKYQDARVRRALNLAFDYETLKRTVFFDLYDRIDSYFFGTELAAKGQPSPEELALLEPLRDKLPPAVFTTPYVNPVGGTSEAVRDNLRQAVALFAEAGWTIQNGKMRNAKGEPFRIEYLTFSQLDERYVAPYAKSLARIGIDLDYRLVDDAQYQNRVRSFDFDMTVDVWGETLSPGNEQREYWGSKAADRPGSRNTAGIKDAAIDALIDKVVYAGDRAALVTRDACARPGAAGGQLPHPACSIRRTASMPTGTASAIRRRCRNTRSGSPISGGTTQPARQRPAFPAEHAETRVSGSWQVISSAASS